MAGSRVKRLPVSFKSRLTSIKVDGKIKSEYSYDIFGNPTNYNGETMEWERGTQLKSYLGQSYSYDAQGHLYSKSGGGRTWKNYYDGDKLIAHKIDCDKWLIIRYFYDTEGIAGFKIGTSDKYTYAKDGQGNVVGLMSEGQIIAKYVYDAWGNCTVTGPDGEEITAWDDPAVLNPIRWKSQYYDADTGLYLIGQRWYDPETGRYISSASPESLLENAGVVYALNLYAFCAGNPLAVLIAASTFLPEFELYYNGEYKTWWEANGKWVLLGIGVAATIAACIAAPFTCGASSAVIAIGTTLAKIALGTAIGAAVSLAIGGTIAGIQGALTGHGFWQSFGESVSENFVDAVVTSFAFTAVTIAAGNIIKAKIGKREHDFDLDPRSIEQARQGNPSWDTFRKRVWKNEAKFNSSKYDAGQLARMKQGLAPQVDGVSMQLHHVVGKANDMYNVVKLTRNQHVLFHRTYGYRYNPNWNMQNLINLFG